MKRTITIYRAVIVVLTAALLFTMNMVRVLRQEIQGVVHHHVQDRKLVQDMEARLKVYEGLHPELAGLKVTGTIGIYRTPATVK